LGARPEGASKRLDGERPDHRWECNACVVRQRAKEGDTSADLTEFGRTDRGDPPGRDWATECHRRDDWGDGDGYERPPRHSYGQGTREQRDDRPKDQAGDCIRFA
jgi:hypothetical protein